MKLTLGFSPCPNDTFIFGALVQQLINWRDLEFEFVIEDVEALNQRALARSLDVTKLSFHAFAHCYKDYVLLRSGSALGQGCGPLLVCRPGSEQADVSSMSVAIPGRLTTANFLLDFYQKDCHKEVLVFDQIESAVSQGRVDAGVIIHENRFTYADRGLEKIVDLGEYWEKQTNLPIPLGGIAAQRKIPAETLGLVSALIRESLEYAFAYSGEIMPFVRRYAQEMEQSIMMQHIELYVNEYSLELDSTATSAIQHFLAQCGVLNELPAIIGKTGQNGLF